MARIELIFAKGKIEVKTTTKIPYCQIDGAESLYSKTQITQTDKMISHSQMKNSHISFTKTRKISASIEPKPLTWSDFEDFTSAQVQVKLFVYRWVSSGRDKPPLTYLSVLPVEAMRHLLTSAHSKIAMCNAVPGDVVFMHSEVIE